MKAGTFVSWPASKGLAHGRVVSVHTGKVPGIVTQMAGTVEAPIARVQLYAKSGDGWEATTVHLGHPVAGLTTITALTAPTAPASEAVVAGSFDEIRQNVQAAIRARIAAATGTTEHIPLYVLDIGPSWAVYETGPDWTDLWMVDYALDDTGEVTLGEPVAVCKVITYVPEDGGEAATEGRQVLTNMAGNTVQDLGPALQQLADYAASSGIRLAETSTDRVEGRLLAALDPDPATGGRVFAVQIIAYGDSKNGRRYPETVMRAAAPLYEGAQAFDHHRTLAELNSGTVVGMIGHYRNVTAGTTGLEGELHLLPSATHIAELLDQTLANQAEGMPLMAGISHDVMTTAKPITVNGRSVQEVTAVLSVNSADVVSAPAAGGVVTRMVAGGTGDPNAKEAHVKTLKQLLVLLRAAESAGRPALLEEYAQVIEASGLTVDEVTAMAAAPATVPAAPPVPPAGAARVEEAMLTKGSIAARLVVDQALATAKLPAGGRLAEAILDELPDQFTEGELLGRIESTKRTIEASERGGLAPTIQAIESGLDTVDKKIAALDAMFAGDFRNGYRSLKEAYVDFTGRTPRWSDAGDFNREILRESASFVRDGERVGYDGGMSARDTESVLSTTWSLALGDSITRRMVAEYAQPSLQSWRQIVSQIVPITDFREQKIERIGGYGVLPTVLQGAPYQPLSSPGNDTEPKYTIGKKGGTEDLTLETIANDDMRVITRIPSKLGLAAAQTVYRYIWDMLDTNATIYDATALFTAGHANTAALALSGANVSAVRKKMRKQTAYGDTSNVLSAVPKFLVGCTDVEELAWQICTSPGAMPSGAPVGAATDLPNIHQGVTPITVDYWSSTTSWFLVADPAMIPTIEMGFYQGKEDPELFVQADPASGSYFSADKVTYKVRHIYAGAVLDFRGFQRGNV